MTLFSKKNYREKGMVGSSPKTMGTFFGHYTTTTKKLNQMGKSYADQKKLLHYT